ncbi:hypothetical protein Ddye_021563 [Dipteronia dyeriana]|uniref:Zinc finger PMZ-type domain-containing protein n=1 Tax=Dipteronia dyeriana TaxID=168575 RepID=A0AAD9WXN2_9ROSI|nr:hypothetical protein Ddye_021563 [Dipteronia dyeriana]
MLWKAAKEGNEVRFKQVMERMKGVSVEAYQWLMNIPIDRWARHHFDTRIKSDNVTNNISECFNSWIKDDEDKPFLTLMEIIRRKVMVRISEKWVLGEKLSDTITPKARKRLNKAENDGRNLIVYHGRERYYKTCDSYGQRCLVKLFEMSCDCGVWQISGLPCAYATTVIDYQGHSIHEYTD